MSAFTDDHRAVLERACYTPWEGAHVTCVGGLTSMTAFTDEHRTLLGITASRRPVTLGEREAIEAALAEIDRLHEVEDAARVLPDGLATFFYTDDPVVPFLHRLWATLGRKLPGMCLCPFCAPDAQP